MKRIEIHVIPEDDLDHHEATLWAGWLMHLIAVDEGPYKGTIRARVVNQEEDKDK